MTCLTAKKLSLVVAGALALVSFGAPAPAEAQMRALLPTIDQVEPLEQLPIDGVWEIREIRKRIIIDSGHAYAVDSWVHMMLFRIEPDQVVMKNIRELADGDFIAQDLPLVANVTLEWVDEFTLRGRTDGLVPVVYHLDRGGDFGVIGPRPGPDELELIPPGGRPFPRQGGTDDPIESKEDEEYVSPW